MRNTHMIRTLGLVGLLVGLLTWSGPAEAKRFVVLGTGEVFDTATSLRWQQTPGAPGDTVSPCDNGNRCTWFEAWDYCQASGARLPGRKELESLLDFSQGGPALPIGHPFIDENGDPTVKSVVGGSVVYYWSASARGTVGIGASVAWLVNFLNSGLDERFKEVGNELAWCVRGKEAFDGQNIVPPAP